MGGDGRGRHPRLWPPVAANLTLLSPLALHHRSYTVTPTVSVLAVMKARLAGATKGAGCAVRAALPACPPWPLRKPTRLCCCRSRSQGLAPFPARSASPGHSLLKKKADALNMRFRQILKKIVDTKEEMGKVMKASFFSLAQVGAAASHAEPGRAKIRHLVASRRHVARKGEQRPALWVGACCSAGSAGIHACALCCLPRRPSMPPATSSTPSLTAWIRQPSRCGPAPTHALCLQLAAHSCWLSGGAVQGAESNCVLGRFTFAH